MSRLKKITAALRHYPQEILWIVFALGLLIYGESIWRYPVLLFGLVLMAQQFRRVDWDVLPSFTVTWWANIAWIMIMFFGTFKSIQVPASVQTLALPIFGLLWLWFVSGIQRQRLVLQRFIIIASWGFGSLATISINLQLFFPQIANYLPRLNYLYSSFGHNHLASLLVLLLPFIWMQALSTTGRTATLYVKLAMWLVILVGGLLGRVAMLLALFELAMVIFWQRKTEQAKQLQQTWIALCVFLILLLGFKQWLVSTGTEEWLCTQEVWSQGFCRDNQQELRWQYWQQAWDVGNQNWLLGTGPGTFPMASRAVMRYLGQNTAFAHNWVLAAYAETGMLGAVVYGSLLLSFALIWWQRHKTILGQSIGLSLVSFLVMASVDFDNQLFVVWLFLLTLLGLCVRQPVRKTLMNQHHKPVILLRKLTSGLIGYLLVGILTCFGVLTAVGLVRLQLSGLEAALTVWPLLPMHPTMIGRLPTERVLKQLMHVYRNDPDILFSISSLQPQHDSDLTLQRVVQLDPWKGIAANQLSRMPDATLAEYQNQVEKYWTVVHQAMLSGNGLSAEFRLWFADSIYNLSARLFADKQWYLSGVWLVRAQQVDPWVISTHPPLIREHAVTAQMYEFARPFTGVRRDFFGDNQDEYTKVFNQLFLLKSQEVMINVDLDSRKMVAHRQNGNAMDSTKYRAALLQYGKEMKIVGACFVRLLPTFGERFSYVTEDVSNALLMVADYSRRQDTDQIADLYGLAIRVKPWVMNDRAWWFMGQPITDDDRTDLEQFIGDWRQWSGDGIGHDPQKFIELIVPLNESATADFQYSKRRYYENVLTQLRSQLGAKNVK